MTIEWYAASMAASVGVAGREELARQAERLLTEAKKEVPVDTGELMRSGSVALKNAGNSAEVSFNKPYAATQHENLAFVHPVGKAKYLEDPLVALAPSIFEAICKAESAALGRGGR